MRVRPEGPLEEEPPSAKHPALDSASWESFPELKFPTEHTQHPGFLRLGGFFREIGNLQAQEIREKVLLC